MPYILGLLIGIFVGWMNTYINFLPEINTGKEALKIIKTCELSEKKCELVALPSTLKDIK